MNSCYPPLCGKLQTAGEPVEVKMEPSHNVKLVKYMSATFKIWPGENVPAEENPSLKHQSVGFGKNNSLLRW